MDKPTRLSRSPIALLAPLPGLTLLLAALLGCEPEPTLDLGYRPARADERPTNRSAFDGKWIGEAEDPFASGAAYHFPSGSSQIVLELDAAASRQDGTAPPGGASRITFGAGPGPAPATDPDVGYPRDPKFNVGTEAASDGSIEPPTEGFRYTLWLGLEPRSVDAYDSEFPDPSAAPGTTTTTKFFSDGLIMDGKADYHFSPNEVVDSWCKLQTVQSCPFPYKGDLGNDPETGTCWLGALPPGVPIDCQKLSMCALRNLCDCPASGPCQANYGASGQLTLALNAEGLVGVFSGAVFLNERGYQQPLGVVRFHRSPDAAAK